MKRARGAKVFVRRKSDGKYLVLTASKWPERPDRSQKPDRPGGITEQGETFATGLIRELGEETGIVADESQLVHATTSRMLIRHRLIFLTVRIYLLELDDPDVTISWEHEAYRWCRADELSSLAIRQPYRAIIKSLLKKKVLH